MVGADTQDHAERIPEAAQAPAQQRGRPVSQLLTVNYRGSKTAVSDTHFQNFSQTHHHPSSPLQGT